MKVSEGFLLGNNISSIENSSSNASNSLYRTEEGNFLEDLKTFVLSVDKELKKSKELKEEFIRGKDIPLYQISVQSQKAKISLELLVKIRDELLKAYKEVISMQV
jgi:flagellar hook-basal body complex protein FliE